MLLCSLKITSSGLFWPDVNLIVNIKAIGDERACITFSPFCLVHIFGVTNKRAQ